MLEFFTIFPFFASTNFYILSVAIGYLRSNNKRLFLDLGFLVPFATIISYMLKSIFNIARPDATLHLTDTLSFPSADAQIATIFWGLIALNYKSSKLGLLGLLAAHLIALISISIVYLGVHTAVDVAGG